MIAMITEIYLPPCKGPLLHPRGYPPHRKALLLYTEVNALKMTQEVEVARHKLHASSSREVLQQTTGVERRQKCKEMCTNISHSGDIEVHIRFS